MQRIKLLVIVIALVVVGALVVLGAKDAPAPTQPVEQKLDANPFLNRQ